MSEDEAYLVYGTCLQPGISFCIDNNRLSYLSSLVPRPLPHFILKPWRKMDHGYERMSLEQGYKEIHSTSLIIRAHHLWWKNQVEPPFYDVLGVRHVTMPSNPPLQGREVFSLLIPENNAHCLTLEEVFCFTRF